MNSTTLVLNGVTTWITEHSNHVTLVPLSAWAFSDDDDDDGDTEVGAKNACSTLRGTQLSTKMPIVTAYITSSAHSSCSRLTWHLLAAKECAACVWLLSIYAEPQLPCSLPGLVLKALLLRSGTITGTCHLSTRTHAGISCSRLSLRLAELLSCF